MMLRDSREGSNELGHMSSSFPGGIHIPCIIMHGIIDANENIVNLHRDLPLELIS